MKGFKAEARGWGISPWALAHKKTRVTTGDAAIQKGMIYPPFVVVPTHSNNKAPPAEGE